MFIIILPYFAPKIAKHWRCHTVFILGQQVKLPLKTSRNLKKRRPSAGSSEVFWPDAAHWREAWHGTSGDQMDSPLWILRCMKSNMGVSLKIGYPKIQWLIMINHHFSQLIIECNFYIQYVSFGEYSPFPEKRLWNVEGVESCCIPGGQWCVQRKHQETHTASCKVLGCKSQLVSAQYITCSGVYPI